MNHFKDLYQLKHLSRCAAKHQEKLSRASCYDRGALGNDTTLSALLPLRQTISAQKVSSDSSIPPPSTPPPFLGGSDSGHSPAKWMSLRRGCL